jgi:hypothetical protein
VTVITQTKRRRSFRLNGARMHRLERTAALTNCSPAQLASEMLERQLDDEKVTHLVDLAEKARLRYLELVADPVSWSGMLVRRNHRVDLGRVQIGAGLVSYWQVERLVGARAEGEYPAHDVVMTPVQSVSFDVDYHCSGERQATRDFFDHDILRGYDENPPDDTTRPGVGVRYPLSPLVTQPGGSDWV